ncbi:MAG: hypothetical protein Q4B40_06430 [Clostridia bacterium]|nr:hypothetical protein [Clostridia bacterium]
MKKFFKFLGALLTVFSAVVAALAIFDRFGNKNRIKDGYLELNNNDQSE